METLRGAIRHFCPAAMVVVILTAMATDMAMGMAIATIAASTSTTRIMGGF